MRAIVYSRVSTDAQERDGTSLDTQERHCLDFARQQGWRVVETVRDTASGYTLDRPGMERIRRLVRDGAADVLLSYAVDRLARNQTKLAVLLDEADEAGIVLECVTEKVEDSPLGKLVMSLRAFAAEVEREKIVERTTRGKLERAKSGRIPQAFGRGCYGYVYNPATGQREIEPFQAEIVRRIFTRFTELRSFDKVSHELNQQGITTYVGGSWHPVGVRRVLENESYTGRLLFRRSRWIKVRGKDGKLHRKRVERPAEDRIEIPDASPRIIDDALWDRVQQIMNDPERVARRPKVRHEYPLRGRVKCSLCGSAMVGQTMTNRGHIYHYYVCRSAFSRRSDRTCEGRNVRSDRLEPAIWREIRAKLTTPEIILQELRRGQPEPDREEVERLESRIARLTEGERRLVRLYTSGEIDEAMFQSENAEMKQQRKILEDRLLELRPSAPRRPAVPDADLVERACEAVGRFLDNAGPEDRALALEALQIAVRATPTKGEIRGIVPFDTDVYCHADEHPDARGKMKNSGRSSGIIPLTVACSRVATTEI
jgi:site-specific DNA recombinase